MTLGGLSVEEHERLRDRLLSAQRSGSPLEVQAACREAVKVWDDCGGWPDSWHDWRRALEDSLPWSVAVDFDDVVYGRAEVKVDH